jgi:cytochrome c oxidase assembly factor CtaG
LSFAAGLATILLALESPIDRWAQRLLWVHMLQHEMLTMVAAPLILLGSPMLAWRGIPVETRRRMLRRLLSPAAVRVAWHRVGRSGATLVVVWVSFVGDFAIWHVPALYDLALERQSVHDFEHILFLGTALLFWSQIIPSLPIPRRLNDNERVVYLGSAALVNALGDFPFLLATEPLYPYYATVAGDSPRVSALVDQSIAGGVMEAVGTGTLFLALLLSMRQAGRFRERLLRPPA